MPASFIIAVTGHRFIPHAEALETSIQSVFELLLASHTTPAIYLYSALAEGADQLVARIAQNYLRITLWVPLPLEIDAYLKDFSNQTSRRACLDLLSTAGKIINLPPINGDQNPYETLGHYLVDQADVLIALWDGVYNDKKGGTGDVVLLARQAGKPVYWIYCPNLSSSNSNNLKTHKKIGDLEIISPLA